MLPKNNLRRLWMNRLKLFAEEEHPYTSNIFKCYDPQDPIYTQLQSKPEDFEPVKKD